MCDKKGSGRTTRLLFDAAVMAEDGYYVIVVCDNLWHTYNHLMGLRPGVRAGETPKIYYSNGGSVNFCTDERLNWTTLRFNDVAPPVMILIDHYVIEKRFSRILQEMRRYDRE